MNSLIDSFESYPECLGKKFSHYFVRDYESFRDASMEEMVEEEEDQNKKALEPFSKAAMSDFLAWPEFQHWNGFVKFDEKGMLSRFWATVSYHGEGLGDFQVRRRMLNRWRATADEFATLNVSIFDDYAPFVDTLETILPATISTSICTLICMMVVCFLFMYNIFTVFVATLAITSICIGMIEVSVSRNLVSFRSVRFPFHVGNRSRPYLHGLYHHEYRILR